MNSVIETTSMANIIEFYNNLKKEQENINIILFIDIDGTVLSEIIGKKFVENNVKHLIESVYDSNPDNLIFITTRPRDIRKKTINKLNSVKMHPKREYIFYNLIMSEFDNIGNSTKGPDLVKYIQQGKGRCLLDKSQNNYIIFIDNEFYNIESVQNSIGDLNIPYKLFHYTHDSKK